MVAPASASVSRTDHAHRELKRGLLVGEFPLGVRLVEERLAERVGVSRTPVREAIVRLEADGLLRRVDGGGVFPVAPDLETVAELYEVRRVLELHAVAGPHDLDAVHRLRTVWACRRAEDVTLDGSFVEADEVFHEDLARAAGNHALAETLASANERIRIVRAHDFLGEERIRVTIAEHVRILDELLAGGPRAAELLADHLDLSRRAVLDRAAHAIARMADTGRPRR